MGKIRGCEGKKGLDVVEQFQRGVVIMESPEENSINGETTKLRAFSDLRS